MEEYKFWMFNKKRVTIIERYGESTLIEYVRSGIQASVKTSHVISVTVKNTKKEISVTNQTQIKKNNNSQLNLDL